MDYDAQAQRPLGLHKQRIQHDCLRQRQSLIPQIIMYRSFHICDKLWIRSAFSNHYHLPRTIPIASLML